MIQIEINRWTIIKLEEAIEKYNKEKGHYTIHEYSEMIHKLLQDYLKETQKPERKRNEN